MKRPKQKSKLPNKPKALAKRVPQEDLDDVADRARYTTSDYHCYGPNGERPKRRSKPAMHCPREWTLRQGLNAVRAAIKAGHISQAKIIVGDGNNWFPRHIWHQEGDTWYEARTVDGAPGEYHGYPVEISGLPTGLTR